MWRITHARQQPEDGNGGGGDSQNPPGVHDITTQQPAQQPSPFQQRIGELTGTIKEQKDALARQQEVIQQLMAAQAQIQAQIAANNRPAAPAAPQIPQLQLPEGVDPTVASLFQQQTQVFQQMLAQQQQQTEALIQQTAGQQRMTVAQLELQTALNGQPVEVQQLAQKLYMDWQRSGNTGWAPKDAVIYARGQLGITGQPVRQTHANVETVTPGGSVQPPTTQGQALPPPLPPEALQKMSLAQEEAYWRKRLEAQGGVDQPIRLS